MRSTTAAATSAAILALMSPQASAADLYGSAGSIKDEAPAAPTWTGFFVGAGLGYGSSNAKLSGTPGQGALDDGAPPDAFVLIDSLGLDGGIGTLAIGGDFQIARRIVAGAFFDYDLSNLSAGAIGSAGGGTFFDIESIQGKAGIDSMWAAGARLGFLTSPDTLWFATAGYTQAKLDDLNGSVDFDGDTSAGSIAMPDMRGYFVGGGVESRLWQNVTLKLEYRYSDFSKERINLAPLDPDLDDYVNVFVDPTVQTVRATLNYRFTP